MTDEQPTPQEEQTEQPVTLGDIAGAEAVIGLTFTESERDFMLDAVNAARKRYAGLRAVKLENAVPPPLYFDPRLPDQRHPQPFSGSRVIAMSPQGDVKRPDNLEDVAFYPVTQLAELVRTRQVTSVELTEMYLARLKHYNKYLECVVTFTDALAMEQARRADAEIAAGKVRGPLHGIPWGAKDLLAVPGYPTTWGAAPYKEQVIDETATVVERLNDAGAVLIAKLTLGALAYNDIWFGGKTRNPWNIEQGSSGSSAGSAAATAAGLVGFAIGTETLGSIVSPSTRCGTTGLRPTFGRVSRHGAMALSWTMDKIGPICRTVEDCALVFNALYGTDGKDPFAIDAPFTWAHDLDLRTLRIGYVESAFAPPPPPEPAGDGDDDAGDSAANLQAGHQNDLRVLDVLRGLGIDLIPVALPEFDYEALLTILFAEAAAAFDEITRLDLDDQMVWQDKQAWPNTFRAAQLIPAVAYIQANRIRTLAMQATARLMETIDVFVVPSFGGHALTLTNLTGHPSVVLPNGFNAQGAPTSITFIGGLFREAETLAVARAYQNATDFHVQHPPMAYG